MNVSNAAMGTGVLAFPLAYKQAGWLFGTLLTLGYGVIMTITLIIIARAARQYEAISYQDLLGQMFGPKTKSFLMCKLSTRDRKQTWPHVFAALACIIRIRCDVVPQILSRCSCFSSTSRFST